jgi:hypothetical protein
MRDVYNRSRIEAAEFLNERGIAVNPDGIDGVYSGVFVNRVVAHMGSSVLKARPLDPEAEREVEQMRQVIDVYRNVIPTIPEPIVIPVPEKSYMAILLPDLGMPVGALATEIDMQELGEESSFGGFDRRHAEALLRDFEQLQEEVRYKTSLIHGDIFTSEGPNNVVYNTRYDALFLVDGEAWAPATEERDMRYESQLHQLRAWVLSNLVTP